MVYLDCTYRLEWSWLLFWYFLDVNDIKFVVNYDYPNQSEDYVHRIGRTARAEKAGTAYTFMTDDNANQVKDLISVLQESKQAINPELYTLMEKSRGSSSFKGEINILTSAHVQ